MTSRPSMRSLLPPLFRGKIATTPGRLLAAAAAMLVCDLLFFSWQGVGVMGMNFYQVVALIIVLLLAPRRWVALLLMLPLWYVFTPDIMAMDEGGHYGHLLLNLVPLVLGVFIACPRPRKRWVYVEEEPGTDAAKGEGADSPGR